MNIIFKEAQMIRQTKLGKQLILLIILVSTMSGGMSLENTLNEKISLLTNIQSKLLSQESIQSVIDTVEVKVDLCDYDMPSELCNNEQIIERLLHTRKLSMKHFGDIKLKMEKVLYNLHFEREEKSVYTFDNGLYFFQCSEWCHGKDRITFNVIGINEHPSVGWFFTIILSSFSPNIPSKYKGTGH
ncbi:MAG: hypothetical protein K8S23_12905 [Candidatus Cloacimonetes bacterium]|nr:hypothetical protein [Candidatus Cloacimonadota bacterium]